METISTLETSQTNNLESTFKPNEQDAEIENNLQSDFGDDGDVSSDDSLRLRLSDDEEAEIDEDSLNNRQTTSEEKDETSDHHQNNQLLDAVGTNLEDIPSENHIAVNNSSKTHLSKFIPSFKVKRSPLKNDMHINKTRHNSSYGRNPYSRNGSYQMRFSNRKQYHHNHHHHHQKHRLPINLKYYNARSSFCKNKYKFSPMKKINHDVRKMEDNEEHKSLDPDGSKYASQMKDLKCNEESESSNLNVESNSSTVVSKLKDDELNGNEHLENGIDVDNHNMNELDEDREKSLIIGDTEENASNIKGIAEEGKSETLKIEKVESNAKDETKVDDKVDNRVDDVNIDNKVDKYGADVNAKDNKTDECHKNLKIKDVEKVDDCEENLEIKNDDKIDECHEPTEVKGGVTTNECDDNLEMKDKSVNGEKETEEGNDNSENLNVEDNSLEIDEKSFEEEINVDVEDNESMIEVDEERESSKTTSLLYTDENSTCGDKPNSLEEMSIDICSDNECENISNSVDSSQDSMTNEDSSNDKVLSEAFSGDKGNMDDDTKTTDEKTNENYNENNAGNDDKIDDSIEDETLQMNSENEETQAEGNSSKRGDDQLVEEVDIDENNDNQIDLYGTSDINIHEDSEKNEDLNTNEDLNAPSPSSLKRNMNTVNDDDDIHVAKKAKLESDIKIKENSENEKPKCLMNKPKLLQHVRDIFENEDNKLGQMTQEKLMDLLIQKYAEAITMNSEIGKLKEQLQIADKNQEALKLRCQQLTKQLKDFDMVLKRNEIDRKTSNDKFVAPIKINRSVGLQVTLLTDQGMQTLRQVQGTKSATQSGRENRGITVTNGSRRGIKIHSPRRTVSTTSSVTPSAQTPQTVAIAQSVSLPTTTTAVVVTKATELPQISRTITLPNNNVRNTVATTNQSSPKVTHVQQKHIVINNNIASPANRQIATLNVQKVQQAKSNDLIDLTDEDDKKKALVTSRGPTIVTQATTQATILSDTVVKHTSQSPQVQGNARYQRVIQTISGNLINPSSNIRVVQPGGQLTSTSLVANNNAPRLTYIMPTGVGQGRQVLITNSNNIRPVNTTGRNQYSTVTYKTNVTNATGVTSLQNGTITRILTTPANIQIPKHPAPLPAAPPCEVNPMLKLPPPAPSLKVTKMGNGIVLSWTMSLSDKYEDIASYQLFAYQEVAGTAPSTTLWKKVGDVRALPLPMACTLTQFASGNNYYFAVRAVDTHSRLGQYSQPGNISL